MSGSGRKGSFTVSKNKTLSGGLPLEKAVLPQGKGRVPGHPVVQRAGKKIGRGLDRSFGTKKKVKTPVGREGKRETKPLNGLDEGRENDKKTSPP